THTGSSQVGMMTPHPILHSSGRLIHSLLFLKFVASWASWCVLDILVLSRRASHTAVVSKALTFYLHGRFWCYRTQLYPLLVLHTALSRICSTPAAAYRRLACWLACVFQFGFLGRVSVCFALGRWSLFCCSLPRREKTDIRYLIIPSFAFFGK
ncbi:hypothetical protein BKA70DRAFT_1291399, partial [Coprinopsis sp. MPI-PUGE-AT-0042]